MPLPLLEERPGWLAVNKPAGMLVIPGRSGEEPSLWRQLEAERSERLFVVHRLDRDTSGVLLLARTAVAHRELSMAFEAGRIEKRYLALVRGRWEREERVDVALVSARKGRMRAARPGEAGKLAETRFRPLEH